MVTEYCENKRKTKYFQPSELPMNLRLLRKSGEGKIFLVFLGTNQSLYQAWETRFKVLQAPEQVSNVFQPN